MSTAHDDMNDRHGRSPSSGIIESLTPPDRITRKREEGLPVTWEDVDLLREWADGWRRLGGEPLVALADRLEAWLREQSRKAA